MNLKFWQRPVSAPTYHVKPRILTEAERGRANVQRLLALGGVPSSHPIWQTVLSYADEHAANEQEAALRPDLINDVRQYNAGRAAAALDFALALRELHVKAQIEAAKMEKKP